MMGGFKRAFRTALIMVGCLVAALALLLTLRYGATAPPTSVVEEAVSGPTLPNAASGPSSAPMTRPVTVADLVYFGAVWQMLNKNIGEAPIILGNGYTNARVERTADGLFFAGLVDKVDASGRVTDVVLAFAGAQGTGDFIQGESLAFGRVLGEPNWAAVLFERIWADPRYAHARIYVTGHSLGAGYAQFVGTEAVARHGIREAASRMRIVGFGVPNWGTQAARYYHVAPHVLDRLFIGYTALNDPVITNGGTDRVGVSRFLPPFTGLTGASSIFNRLAAHWPTTYVSALGLPTWLTASQKNACIARVSRMFITGKSYDPSYAQRRFTR